MSLPGPVAWIQRKCLQLVRPGHYEKAFSAYILQAYISCTPLRFSSRDPIVTAAQLHVDICCVPGLPWPVRQRKGMQPQLLCASAVALAVANEGPGNAPLATALL